MDIYEKALKWNKAKRESEKAWEVYRDAKIAWESAIKDEEAARLEYYDGNPPY